jgi:putative methyltransferase (TIGR04325 family)
MTPNTRNQLSDKIKCFAREWLLAPKTLAALKKLAIHNRPPEESTEQYGFFPASSFDEAKRASKGWHDPQLVSELMAGYRPMIASLDTERDIVGHFMQFATAFFASYLQLSPPPPQRKISVLDYGGASGELFFRMKNFAPQLLLDWTVVETDAMAAAFKKEGGPDIRWIANHELNAATHYDICLLSGFLQCVENPYVLLHQCARQANFLIINFIPLTRSGEDRASIRRCKWSSGDASYPLWFFSEKRFCGEILKVGEVVFSWQVADRAPHPRPIFLGSEIPYIGLLVKSKRP